jgi:3-deoxy-manno-octulosonate cytidylyltransferase (CMP-KDO synthetase)
MKIIAVIPARMGSTRFPGKPLADILGLPMVEHVRRRVALSPIFSDVVVATCDQEIMNVVKNSGGHAVMTASTHQRCTDRIAEASENLNADIIVNVQGDEPLVHPEMFMPLVAPLKKSSSLNCVNLMSVITNEEEYLNQNVVKVVFDKKVNALFFSREPLPSRKMTTVSFDKYKQLGVIAFRKDFLLKFTQFEPTPLEIIESNDMLRILENGYTVHMVKSEFPVVGVDTTADLEKVKIIMKNDPVFPKYYKYTL